MTNRAVPLGETGFHSLPRLQQFLLAASDIDTSSHLKDYSEVLYVLGSMIYRGSNPQATIRETPGTHKHLHFAFALACNNTLKDRWISCCSVAITVHRCTEQENAYLLVVSGTLEQWRQCLTDNLTKDQSIPLREQLTSIALYFESKGINYLFDGFSKHTDQTGLYLT